MATFKISYAYYKIDKNGKPGGKTSTSRKVQAVDISDAKDIVRGMHSGYEIEWRGSEKID